jgi:hypothetical protein
MNMHHTRPQTFNLFAQLSGFERIPRGSQCALHSAPSTLGANFVAPPDMNVDLMPVSSKQIALRVKHHVFPGWVAGEVEVVNRKYARRFSIVHAVWIQKSAT